MRAVPPGYTRQDLLLLKQLIEAGRYLAVIDRCYSLEQAAEAARYVDRRAQRDGVA